MIEVSKKFYVGARDLALECFNSDMNSSGDFIKKSKLAHKLLEDQLSENDAGEYFPEIYIKCEEITYDDYGEYDYIINKVGQLNGDKKVIPTKVKISVFGPGLVTLAFLLQENSIAKKSIADKTMSISPFAAYDKEYAKFLVNRYPEIYFPQGKNSLKTFSDMIYMTFYDYGSPYIGAAVIK